ncbi:hypothetical protein [Variovorax sp.]|jgi:hypothetical protein|uniref:hypothetical protein n=1 Tax=Variovorax sp. TaxID=1871043 RepID=UPI0037D9E4CE
MAELSSSSIVSFWFSQYDMAPSNFACSGVFIGSKRILTVAHVFNEGRQLWIRPKGDMGQAFRPIAAPELHPNLDAALVDIEIMPPDCVPARLDLSDALPSNGTNSFLINGFYDGKYELPHSSGWVTFEADDRMHRMDTKQPKGHSGSGLSRGGLLWGITISHYIDPNVHRGCALSLSQLWPEWLERFVPLPVTNKEDRQYDVGWYERMIQEEIGNMRLNAARELMLKLIENFPTTADKHEAARISYHINEFEDIKKSRRLTVAERKELDKWMQGMMSLAARVVDRLERDLKGGPNA